MKAFCDSSGARSTGGRLFQVVGCTTVAARYRSATCQATTTKMSINYFMKKRKLTGGGDIPEVDMVTGNVWVLD